MSEKQALTDLLEAVEAGEFPADTSARDLGFEGLSIKDFYDPYSGSLDAAKALHEAVLPNFFVYEITSFEGWSVTLGRRTHKEGQWIEVDAEHPTNPARAWLIAILKALIAEGEQ